MFLLQVKISDLERQVDSASDSSQPIPDIGTQFMAERERELVAQRERDLGLEHEEPPVYAAEDIGSDEGGDDDVPISVIMARRGSFMDMLHGSLDDELQGDGIVGGVADDVDQGTGDGMAADMDQGSLHDTSQGMDQGTLHGASQGMDQGIDEGMDQGIAQRTEGMAQDTFSQQWMDACSDADIDQLIQRLDSEAQARPQLVAPHPSISSETFASQFPTVPHVPQQASTPHESPLLRRSQAVPRHGLPPVVPSRASTSSPRPHTAPPGTSATHIAPMRHHATVRPPPTYSTVRIPDQPSASMYEYRPPTYPFRVLSRPSVVPRAPSLGAPSQPLSAWEVPSQPGDLHGADEDVLSAPTPRRGRGRPRGSLNKKGRAPKAAGARKRGRGTRSGERGGHAESGSAYGLACLGADDEPDWVDHDGEESSPGDGIPEFGRTYALREARGPEIEAPEDSDETQPLP